MAVEVSPPVVCAAGTKEHHSYATLSFQFETKHRITNIYVNVISEPKHEYNYKVGIDLVKNQGTEEQWWSRVTYRSSKDEKYWTFNINMDNWSHDNARVFHIVVEYQPA